MLVTKGNRRLRKPSLLEAQGQLARADSKSGAFGSLPVPNPKVSQS